MDIREVYLFNRKVYLLYKKYKIYIREVSFNMKCVMQGTRRPVAEYGS
jgi:hypothetical protein